MKLNKITGKNCIQQTPVHIANKKGELKWTIRKTHVDRINQNDICYVIIMVSNKAYTMKGENNMARLKVRKSKDKKIFKHTAATTKKINLAPRIMRGGIRL